MLNTQQALDILNGMGKTADEVADFLKAKGITGMKRESAHCPVANYLVSQGGDPRAIIYSHYVPPFDEDITTPLPVFDFIITFDEGQYPELEST
jgi:hypothetical protein